MASLLCLSLWLLPVPPQSALDEDIAKAIDRLWSDSYPEAQSGKLELVELGRRATGAVVAEFKSQRLQGEKDERKRARIKRTLCEILGQIRDGSDPVVDALIERLTDPDEFGSSVASAAASALAWIGAERAAPALLQALESKQAKTDPWLKVEAARALGLLRHAPAVEALKKALDDKSAAMIGADEKVHLVRVAAADALGRLRAKDAVEGLGKMLSDAEQNPFTQRPAGQHAARALERILGAAKGALDGDEATVKATMDKWKEWWDAESTDRYIAQTRERLGTLAAAVERFNADQGKYPAVLQYLTSKPPDAKTWPEGGYAKEADLKDPWGMDYYYRSPGTAAPFDIVSYGRDKRKWGRGKDRDLWNHDKWLAELQSKTRTALDATAAAVDKFKEDNGQYPDRLEHLVTKPPYATKWEKPYLDQLLKDGYDAYLLYRKPGTNGAEYDLESQGADQIKGGSDENRDVWNHDKWMAPAQEATKKRLEALAEGVRKFFDAEKRLPEKLADLSTKPSWAKAPWPAGGYTSEVRTDAWGNDIDFRVIDAEKGSFELRSLGADGKDGGEGLDADEAVRK